MSSPSAQTVKDKPSTGTTNRIMARLDGLSGDTDPRLAALRGRFEQLGFTVIAMGVSAASTSSTTQRSAFIVVAIDPAKTDMQRALTQFRALEAFAYVEADQLLQQSK